MGNRTKHPEAWKFFEEQARNMSGTGLDDLGKYRIPSPDMSGRFIYADEVEVLWVRFIHVWYNTESLDAPTIRGRIQYIVNNLS